MEAIQHIITVLCNPVMTDPVTKTSRIEGSHTLEIIICINNVVKLVVFAGHLKTNNLSNKIIVYFYVETLKCFFLAYSKVRSIF